MNHCLFLFFALVATFSLANEQWSQLQGNSLRSGNAPDAIVPSHLGLIGTVPLTDGIYTAPAIADGVVYVVDGSGVASAIDANSLAVKWQFRSRGGAGNCNNVSSPAIVGPYLHFGTMAGYYYVLERATGIVVTELDCQDAIFSSPAVGDNRVYFATLGAQVYSVEPNGTVVWKWDFV